MGALHVGLHTFMTVSRCILLKMRIFQGKVVQNIKTHFIRNPCHLWDSVKKYCSGGYATDDNMTHAHCMLDN